MINLFLFIYCFFISLLILTSGVLNSNNQQIIFQMLFVPVIGYFFYVIIESLIEKKSLIEKIPKLKKPTLIISFFLIILTFLINNKNLYSNTKKYQTSYTSKNISKTTIKPTKKEILIKVKDEFSKDNINVRKEPNLKSQVIDKLNPNKTYKVITVIDQWYKIYLNNNNIGFVKKDFIKEL